MATIRPLIRTSLRPRFLTPICRTCPRCHSSTDAAPAPPLLLRFRADLKTAMRAKDTNKLNTLRGLLSDITNASKTQSPTSTDVQILALLRKRSNECKAAGEGFAKDGRTDLKEKEDAQIGVLEEYAGSVQMMGSEDIKLAVEKVMDQLKGEGIKVEKGLLLKRLVGKDGEFDGKNVDKGDVARVVGNCLRTA